ncbi:TnsD family Tn7-like transposition protein [Endozoicomonas sp. SCSIO W0465]|uniref:TnsD family Tn7-like transposition protein n=1 Tax=Endozoicomonas sp. SCSIO W0465 TaxID=2918516 RepID=UPI002075A958|nr:TnsD family Tn7-like transposition protein [Endozoicomonas sp. SCSIO W0465]USE35000.1 TnsD family transposase [Endozoicomonas sp. SCSIO W0465]
MILKFPRPLPDETFYSWVARYHDQSANHYPLVTVRTIFDCHHGCAISGLPTGLKRFCAQLLPLIKYNPEDIIQFHTPLPYYSSVFSKNKIKIAKQKMLDDFNKGTQGLLGMLASTISEFRYLRYCPECLQKDKETYGVSYWHRSHQLPGVLVCPDHFVPTLNSLVDKQNLPANLFASAEKHAEPNLIQKKIVPDEQLKIIAVKSAQLLTRYRNPITSTNYRKSLLQAGYGKGTLIDQIKLSEAFSSFWSKSLLEQLGVPHNFSSEHSWLRFMTRRKKLGLQAHPIQHILLRVFLKEQPTLCQDPVGHHEFIPPDCPNPFCNQTGENSPVIEETYKHSKSSPLYAIIRCACGFKYSCNTEQQPVYTSNVLQYGETWDQKFTEYVQAGYSIHKLEQLMSVTRPVIKKKAVELNLTPVWLNQVKIKPNSHIMESRVKKHKKVYLEARKKYPELSITELKEKINSTIKFLYRYERGWLDNNRPAKKGKASESQRIDWKKRDQEYLQQVKTIVAELASSPGKPQPINPSKISKILGQNNIFTKIPDKIPVTMAYLEEICRREVYVPRVFEWAVHELRKKGHSITRNNIIRKACIRYTPSPEHEATLKKLIEAGNDDTFQLPPLQQPPS